MAQSGHLPSHRSMSAFGGKADIGGCILLAISAVFDPMYGPAVRCKRNSSSWGICGLASMYPAFDCRKLMFRRDEVPPPRPSRLRIPTPIDKPVVAADFTRPSIMEET